jgi:uncharacterized membrane protein YeaQ/YmgE (transglycosylase-associated protein family)
MLLELVLFVVLGSVVGSIGRFMVVGGWGARAAPWMRLGVLGALFGGILARVAGARAPDPATGAVLASFVGAVVFVALHFARSWWPEPRA